MDIIAISGLVIGGAGTIAAIVAAAKAVTAVRLAKEAPTKEDLWRVESHIARVDGHLSEQNERESLTKLAQRVSISVTGEHRMNHPLTLSLKIKDPSVTLIRVELINDVDMLSGEADCLRLDSLNFSSTVLPQVAQQWFGSCPIYQAMNRKMAYIRAIMKYRGTRGP
jgi:hypothetical protein